MHDGKPGAAAVSVLVHALLSHLTASTRHMSAYIWKHVADTCLAFCSAGNRVRSDTGGRAGGEGEGGHAVWTMHM